MKKPGIVLFNLLIMLGYSVLFIILAPVLGDSDIPVHWSVLGMHILVLSVIGLGNLDSGKSEEGRQFLLAALVVALIGHGLCFFNGLMHLSIN